MRVKTNVIGWVARALTIPCVGIILMFMIGEGFNPFHLSPREALLCLFFPIGVCVGMIVGWIREGLGGLITVVSLALFFVVHYAQWSRPPGGPWFLIFSSGGLLFLVSWLYARLRKSSNQ